MWDNTEDRISSNIEPRILVSVGNVEQVSSEVVRTWQYKGIIKTTVAWLFQCPAQGFSINNSTIDYCYIYGSDDRDLYNIGLIKLAALQRVGFGTYNT